MYKVNYYTLGVLIDGSIGNIKQFDDVWYTDLKIERIPEMLNAILSLKWKESKSNYVGVVTNIEKIKGHI